MSFPRYRAARAVPAFQYASDRKSLILFEALIMGIGYVGAAIQLY